jgi:prevent-host-death family protein
MPISHFKSHCLQLISELLKHPDEEIIITKNAKPVAKVTPISNENRKSLAGLLKGRGQVTGDIISPIDEEWDAEKGVLYNE